MSAEAQGGQRTRSRNDPEGLARPQGPQRRERPPREGPEAAVERDSTTITLSITHLSSRYGDRHAEEAHGTGAVARVLIVEDEPDTRKLLRVMADMAGLEVLEASTAAAAVEQASQRPDLVLLDVRLPDGLGTAVLEAIQCAAPGARIVLHSAAPFYEKRVPVEFVLKPGINRLVEIMREAAAL